MKLWFDVEMIRYTTIKNDAKKVVKLWFDVEMIRYTTSNFLHKNWKSCGLM